MSKHRACRMWLRLLGGGALLALAGCDAATTDQLAQFVQDFARQALAAYLT